MKWLDMGPYKVCYIGLCQTAKDWNQLMADERLGPHEFPREPTTVWFSDGRYGPLIIIAIRNVRRMPRLEAIGYCVHEAVHCWQYVCEFIRAGKTGREIEAYSVQWISGWLIKELNL